MRSITTKVIVAEIVLLALALAIAPFLTSAQTAPPVVMTSVGGFIDLLNTILGWMFTIFMVLAVIMIIWAAFVYLTAGGDEEKVGKAKNMLIYAVVAIVVALLAAGVPKIVQSLLGA